MLILEHCQPAPVNQCRLFLIYIRSDWSVQTGQHGQLLAAVNLAQPTGHFNPNFEGELYESTSVALDGCVDLWRVGKKLPPPQKKKRRKKAVPEKKNILDLFIDFIYLFIIVIDLLWP